MRETDQTSRVTDVEVGRTDQTSILTEVGVRCSCEMDLSRNRWNWALNAG